MKIVLIFIFLTACSNLEFVYKKDKANPLYKTTSYSLNGDRNDIAMAELKKVLGSNIEDKYYLDITIEEKITIEVISSDSTTQKYNVSHVFVYNLDKNDGSGGRCTLLNKKMTTTDNYNSKSAGYNFGTDISKSKTIENNITKNIKNFTGSIFSFTDLKTCKNEG